MKSVNVELSWGFQESGKGLLVNYNLFFSKDLFQLRVGLSPVILLPDYFSPFQGLYSQLQEITRRKPRRIVQGKA